MHKKRIGILDSFRALAILAVMLFHFFSLDDFKFPYGHKYDFFYQGRYGVEFFFIISGFVIFYTLENTLSLKDFVIKRLIRLYPSALVATTLTFLVFLLFSNESLTNVIVKYLTSLSLIGPKLLNYIFSPSGNTFNYLDYSLWSLWPEIQFYFVAGILYFYNKDKFLKHFTIFSLFLIALSWLNSNVKGSNILNLNPNSILLYNLNHLLEVFDLSGFIQYFIIGMQFYMLYKLKHQKNKIPFSLLLSFLLFVFLQLYFAIFLTTRITNVCMIAIFVCFVYFPDHLNFMENDYFRKIGVSSYFLYLIHQAIGLIFIEKFGSFIFPHTFLFPISLIIIFIGLSLFYTLSIEIPTIKKLKNKFLAFSRHY